MAASTRRPIALQSPPSNPAVLLPERFRAETCAFGALVARVSRTESGQLVSGWHHSSPFSQAHGDFHGATPHPFPRRSNARQRGRMTHPRRKTLAVKVGRVTVGGTAPIV